MFLRQHGDSDVEFRSDEVPTFARGAVTDCYKRLSMYESIQDLKPETHGLVGVTSPSSRTLDLRIVYLSLRVVQPFETGRECSGGQRSLSGQLRHPDRLAKISSMTLALVILRPALTVVHEGRDPATSHFPVHLASDRLGHNRFGCMLLSESLQESSKGIWLLGFFRFRAINRR